MQHKKLILLVFFLVALVQIYVPAKMVYNSNVVLDQGTVYKFKTAPVDPNDPFRGKYITLRYDINSWKVEDPGTWSHGQDIYVLLTTNSVGYAKILDVKREKPDDDVDYVKASIDYIQTWNQSPARLIIDYPFDRYYMEESKAYDAEIAYRKSARDVQQHSYALVHIKDGSPIVKDVLINEVPIRELVIEQQLKNANHENNY
ncbi:MAG: GDYXXLXY domain-containing protein [Flavobacteriales bacterium]|nr:GDYXXLXY domain-containing protein [Flavobacteriales bacterium]